MPFNISLRLVLAAVFSLAVLGTVKGYMLFLHSLPAVASHRLSAASAARGHFRVDVTLSFTARADAFSVEPMSLALSLQGGQRLLELTEPIQAGRVVTIDPVEGITEGLNELFIEIGTAADEDVGASPEGADGFGAGPVLAANGAAVARAVRVRVLRDDVVIAEETVWSDPGEPVTGRIILDVPPAAGVDDAHEGRGAHEDEHSSPAGGRAP